MLRLTDPPANNPRWPTPVSRPADCLFQINRQVANIGTNRTVAREDVGPLPWVGLLSGRLRVERVERAGGELAAICRAFVVHGFSLRVAEEKIGGTSTKVSFPPYATGSIVAYARRSTLSTKATPIKPLGSYPESDADLDLG